MQVRVIQGKEPAHLLKCFGDKPMVILTGGRSSSGNDVNFDKSKTNLFQVYFKLCKIRKFIKDVCVVIGILH